MSPERALGISLEGLYEHPVLGWVDPDAAAAFERLQRRARAAGWGLSVASGYRSFDRQLAIFNAKALGSRPVLDDDGSALKRSRFSQSDWLHAILRFSALPGTSRHHWGTDFDIWDPSAVQSQYKLLLEANEYKEGGVFSGVSCWLDELMARDDAEGFFRPYAQDSGGVAPEPWHISYRPSANKLRPLVTAERLRHVWSMGSSDDGPEALCFREQIMLEVEPLLTRYVAP